MQTFRYGMVWRAMGAFPIFLAIAIPILSALNNEKFDGEFVLMLIVSAVLGIWACAYFTKYTVTLGADGLTVVRFARRPLVIAWREIRQARDKGGELTFTTTDHRRIRFNSYFPGYAAIVEAANLNLPEVAFGPKSPPARVPFANDPRKSLRQYFWMTCGFTALYLGLGFAAAHINFHELSRATAGRILSIIVHVRWMSFVCAVIDAVATVFFFIFYLRNVARARR
ncbi:MAG: hypothetical protein JWO97_4102 [Acidobacteria bacterium]|nr:hypothetical protein [Acidobacteriota bacterium]